MIDHLERILTFLFFNDIPGAMSNRNPTIPTTISSSSSSFVVETNPVPLKQRNEVKKFKEMFL